MPPDGGALTRALEQLLDCVERMDLDGRGRTAPITDDELDHAIAAAHLALAASKPRRS